MLDSSTFPPRSRKGPVARFLIAFVPCVLLGTLVSSVIHNNDVLFTKSGLTDLGFLVNGTKITQGQGWGQPPISVVGVSDGSATLRVRAGRKGSSSVADWFNAQSSGGAKFGCGSSDSSPKELNFAFLADLTFVDSTGSETTCPSMVVGQGRSGLQNNWWITAPGMTTVPDSNAIQMQCTRAGTPLTVTFSGFSDCINQFSVSY